MLHQDGSRFAWLAGQPQLDLIVTMDDATNTVYAAFPVEEEGTVSTFGGSIHSEGLAGEPLYRPRQSLLFHREGG